MQCYVSGIGVWGPGLPSWPALAAVLRGESVRDASAVDERPATPQLPPAERRRATLATRVGITVACEALGAAAIDPARVPSVFASSASNPEIIDEMCSTLADGSRALSPIRFHNSVHNSPAGYFGIAVGSHEASTSVCAHDDSAAAGLLDAGLQSGLEGTPVVLVSIDQPYPGPLGAVRPIEGVWGIALVLQPTPCAALGGARLTLRHGLRRPATPMADPWMERARRANPTARLLPLLGAIARGQAADLDLDLGDEGTLAVGVRFA